MKPALLVIWIILQISFAQNKMPVYRCFFAGTGSNFIKYNTFHMRDLKKNIPLLFSMSLHFPLDKRTEQKKHFIFGLRSLFQTIRFRSYYFYPDSLKIYDNTFPVSYRMQTILLAMDLGFKYEFNYSEKYFFTPYMCFAFSFAGPVYYRIEFSRDGKYERKNGSGLYRNVGPARYFCPAGELTLGLQYNLLGISRVRFFLETGYMALSASFLAEKNFLASRLYFHYGIWSVKTGLLF
ncbi:MAG: hypothetical protein N3F09_09255 [Bacteroidia bacterium]|nr:hypothetical protein [Bacteroidia bacterium]